MTCSLVLQGRQSCLTWAWHTSLWRWLLWSWTMPWWRCLACTPGSQWVSERECDRWHYCGRHITHPSTENGRKSGKGKLRDLDLQIKEAREFNIWETILSFMGPSCAHSLPCDVSLGAAVDWGLGLSHSCPCTILTLVEASITWNACSSWQQKYRPSHLPWYICHNISVSHVFWVKLHQIWLWLFVTDQMQWCLVAC